MQIDTVIRVPVTIDIDDLTDPTTFAEIEDMIEDIAANPASLNTFIGRHSPPVPGYRVQLSLSELHELHSEALPTAPPALVAVGGA